MFQTGVRAMQALAREVAAVWLQGSDSCLEVSEIDAEEERLLPHPACLAWLKIALLLFGLHSGCWQRQVDVLCDIYVLTHGHIYIYICA